MSFAIKPVETKQLHLLEKIGKQTYYDHFSEIWSEEGGKKYLQSQFDSNKLKNDLSNPHLKYYLAYWKDKVVGLIKLNFNKPLPNYISERGLELEKIYLLKEFSGKGLGEQMLDFVLQAAKANAETFIWLDALKNNERAKKFYERHGFTVVGEIEFSTDKFNIGMWVMKCQLPR